MATNARPYRFTVSAFFPRPALPEDNPLTEEGVELGRLLFFDPQLSVNNSQSCASCHQTANAFSESRPVSTGAEGKVGTRNAMPLINLAWKSSFFWDGRAATLRQQVLQPIQNPLEMHETLTDLISKLRSSRPQEAFEEKAPSSKLQAPSPQEPALDSAALELGIWDFSGAWSLELGASYPSLFQRAFGSTQITADRIARALEQFLLSQTSYASKFDRVLGGAAQFTAAEQRGFELFHSEYDPRREQYGADCFHCHGGPLFQSQTFANNGLDADFKDLGRFLVTGKEGDRGTFAVPSLRNVEVTGPYMHDGRFRSLEEVIEHYSADIKRSPTLDPNLAKHPDRGIQLSSEDKAALVSFLKTLTDTRFQTNTSTMAQSF